jgi:hypothetical protein
MTPPIFRCTLDPSLIPGLLASYKSAMKKENAALEAGRRVLLGDFSIRNLLSIVEWKASRAKGRVQLNSPEDVKEALKAVVDGLGDRAAVAILTGLNGVRLPMSSAILTAIFPDRFTVIDIRALEALGTRRADLSASYYLAYLGYCRHLALQYNISLRDVDRALWQSSKNKMYIVKSTAKGS